jgi:heat shock protein HslJ
MLQLNYISLENVSSETIVNHTVIRKSIAATLLLTLLISTVTSAEAIRYRGQYTVGHEVNSFCPEINSQCYWLSPETKPEIRQQLQKMVVDNTSKPYEKICIVVEGEINRNLNDKSRIGFAGSYDGLFSVEKIFGLCDEGKIVTQGDLQHHRWVLESINNANVNQKTLHKMPELDFGEKMTVSGNTGCNNFSGHAMLEDKYFYISGMLSTEKLCSGSQSGVEFLLKNVLSNRAEIIIEQKKILVLV